MALLVLIALVALAGSRRLDRERRLLARFRASPLGDGRCGLPRAALSAAEGETAADLAAARVLVVEGEFRVLDPVASAGFRRRRCQLAAGCAIVALALAALVSWALLAR